MTDELHNLGTQFADARAQLATIRHAVRKAALKAHRAGIPETHIADALRVDRSTIRRWLGK